MNPRRKKRLAVVLAIVLGLGSTVGLILYALNQNIDLFYTPSEIFTGKPNGEKPSVGQRLRIGGMVVAGSVKRDSESLLVSFDLKDIGDSVTVTYDGILPDLFAEGQGMIATGTLAKGLFEAKEILAKHDEEYMPKEVADALKEQGFYKPIKE